MVCYRDMTFCPYYKECAVKDCLRASAPEVWDGAREIGLPISEFIEKPKCFEGLPNDKK